MALYLNLLVFFVQTFVEYVQHLRKMLLSVDYHPILTLRLRFTEPILVTIDRLVLRQNKKYPAGYP